MQRKFVKIKEVDEPVGRVILEDGSVHTFRVTIGAVYRILNDDGSVMVHSEGGANYGFNTNLALCTVEEPNDVKLSDWREPVDKKKVN